MSRTVPLEALIRRASSEIPRPCSSSSSARSRAALSTAGTTRYVLSLIRRPVDDTRAGERPATPIIASWPPPSTRARPGATRSVGRRRVRGSRGCCPRSRARIRSTARSSAARRSARGLRSRSRPSASCRRIGALMATQATVLVCTPTYALRLAEVARDDGVDLSRSALRVSIHAGEPGASIPATRSRIEETFGVTCFDHTGATEIGPTGFSCSARDGVHLIEREFVVEIRAEDGSVAEEGEGELVLTNLGRWCSPAIRYRTGDRVRATRGPCACGRTFVKLAGGILGRMDDMLTVRGVNVFPSVFEDIVRRFDDVVEFRIEAYTERGMDALRCTVEPRPGVDAAGLARAVGDAIHRDLGVRAQIAIAEPGSLPRFEL